MTMLADRLDDNPAGYKEAFRFYFAAADQDPIAAWKRGYMASKGYGTAKDEAGEAEMEATLSGLKILADSDAYAARIVGAHYDNKRQWAEAIKWYQKAADGGDDVSMCNLGVYHWYGLGIPIDDDKAMYWYQKSASLGNPNAMLGVGLAYAQGRGATKDEAQAIQWYKKAAEGDSATAMNHLGRAYATGLGVQPNQAEAVRWFRKSADLGDSDGFCNLGLCYANGLGVDKDVEEAVRLYRKSAALGNEQAKTELKRLGRPV